MKTLPTKLATASAVLLLATGTAFSQFPEREITLIVPWSAGGSTDQTARALSAAASEELGQPIVIENRPGASTTLGMTELANADPDGYTIGTLSSTTYMAPLTGTEVTYDMMESFSFVSYYGDNLIGIVAGADRPWDSIEELIEDGTENPGDIVYGTAGVNTTQHLMTEALQMDSGAVFTHIPYSGSAESLPALMGGHVDFLTEVSVWAEQVEAGDVKVLAVNLPERSEAYPEVPTLNELGYRALRSVQGIIGPAGMPEEVRSKLETAFLSSLDDERFVEAMANLRMEIVEMNGEEMREAIGQEVTNASELIETVQDQ